MGAARTPRPRANRWQGPSGRYQDGVLNAQNPDYLQGFCKSPLTDSNRRPFPTDPFITSAPKPISAFTRVCSDSTKSLQSTKLCGLCMISLYLGDPGSSDPIQTPYGPHGEALIQAPANVQGSLPHRRSTFVLAERTVDVNVIVFDSVYRMRPPTTWPFASASKIR